MLRLTQKMLAAIERHSALDCIFPSQCDIQQALQPMPFIEPWLIDELNKYQYRALFRIRFSPAQVCGGWLILANDHIFKMLMRMYDRWYDVRSVYWFPPHLCATHRYVNGPRRSMKISRVRCIMRCSLFL